MSITQAALRQYQILSSQNQANLLQNQATSSQNQDGPAYTQAEHELLDYFQRKVEILEAHGIHIPEDLLCPITGQIIVNPVSAADGRIYEKAALLKWTSKKNTSPITGLYFANNVLHPIILYTNQRDEFFQKYKDILEPGMKGNKSQENKEVKDTK